jgi:putative PIN family toxin of toxin-antitoxin system
VRVVFDSNVLIAALVFPGGFADQAMRRVVGGADHLLVSKPIIQEVLGVLARKFTRDREELARVAAFLADAGELVAATYRADALTDEADNRILECAVSGKADAIVTGDRAMLRLGQYADISIITLRDFLER